MARQRLNSTYLASRDPSHAGAVARLRLLSLEENAVVIDLDDPEARQLFEAIQTRPVAQPKRRPTISKMQREGPALWAKLHQWALTCDLTGKGAAGWSTGELDAFEKLLPCGECSTDFRLMRMRTPLDFGSNAALFKWTVDRHNEVNRKLGKPEMSIEDATARWNPAPQQPARH